MCVVCNVEFCYNVTMLQCFNVTMFQCYNVPNQPRIEVNAPFSCPASYQPAPQWAIKQKEGEGKKTDQIGLEATSMVGEA